MRQKKSFVLVCRYHQLLFRFLVKDLLPRVPRQSRLSAKRVENGERRRLHNEELHSLYRSLNIVRVIKSRRLERASHVVRMEEDRSAFKILTGKPTGELFSGRPRHRWEDNIRMDLKEMGIKTRNWVDSAEDKDYWRALVNAEFNLRVP